MKIKKIKINQKGFTLIELLVVIAIIGILASFAIASFTSAQAKGRDSRRKADLDAIKKALELYRGDQTAGTVPDAIDGTQLTTPGYIKTMPKDPKWDIDYYYSPTNGSLGNYKGYTLRACAENASDPSTVGYVVCIGLTATDRAFAVYSP